MLTRNNGKQDKFIVTTLESLMSADHFLRDLDEHIDFSFIYSKVSHLYSNTGRPSIDPVTLIKMLLLGFLYGIDSERKLVKDIEVNIAYRWFLGIDLDDKIPNHSTISQTRRRKWSGTNIFEDIFIEIVRKCIEAGMVDGSLLLTDSTHVKASASIGRKESVVVNIEPREYIKKLDELCEQEDLAIRAKAITKGLKKRGRAAEPSHKTKCIEKAQPTPTAGFLTASESRMGFTTLRIRALMQSAASSQMCI